MENEKNEKFCTGDGSFQNQTSLCAKPQDKKQRKRARLRYRFLNSSWHTDAKKLPEKLIYGHHLACFFSKNQIFLKKKFLAKTHLEGPKIISRRKKFFMKIFKNS